METGNILNGYGEETLLDGQGTAVAQVLNDEAEARGAAWRKVATGAGFGIMFGSAATLVTDSAIREKEAAVTAAMEAQEPVVEATEEEEVGNSLPYVDNEIRIATAVSDDMSFSQAFATARGEVGSGGAFEWRGNLYSTFTAEEWDGMSAQEHAEYGSHFDWAAYSATHPHHTAQPEAHTGSAEATTTHEDAPVANTSESEIEVLGVVHHSELDMNIGGVLVDGQEVMLVDVDNDEKFDYIVSDLNHDGQLQEEEILDISDAGITVGDMGGFTAPDDNLYVSGDDADYEGGVLL